jgi:hypothetical protein
VGDSHNYYSAASGINPQVWDFLKQHRLPTEPRYQQYRLIAK